MIRLVIERLIHATVSLLAVTVLAFGLVRLTGDPALILLPIRGTPEDYARIRAQLHLNDPLIIQYGRYLTSLAKGDLGQSYTSREPVAGIIEQRLGPTLQLGAVALFLVIGIGIPAGLYSAYWQGGWLDRFSRLIAVLGQSAPAFWVGLLLIYGFAVRLRMLPPGGYGGLNSFILPAATIALGSGAGIIRLMRSCALDVLSTDYIRFCRMKGLSEQKVLWKHTLRNAVLPVLTLVGTLTGSLVAGSIVTETVFAWPGLGQQMVVSINSRDFPVIQGAVLVFAAVYITINLFVDVMFLLLKPSLRIT